MIDKIMTSPNRPVITLLSSFMLAIIHQYLFYGKEVGVSYPIFVILFYGFMVLFTRDRVRPLTMIDAFMAGVVLMLALTFLLYDNEPLRILNFLVVPGLIILHMTYLVGRKQRQWWDMGLIGTAIDHLLPQSIRHWGTVARITAKTGGRGWGKTQKTVAFKVFIGIVASVPILIVVVALLSSADGIFNEYLSGFPEWLNQLTLTPGLPRVIWILIAGVLLFGYVWGFVQPMQYEAEKRENAHWKNGKVFVAASVIEKQGDPSINPLMEGQVENEIIPEVIPTQAHREPFSLDPVIVGTMLLVINCVYVLFVLVQFSYLFGAGEGLLPSDLSYAEYARSGFAELVLVTGINFFILIIALQFTRSSSKAGSVVHQVLLFVLVGCSAIMLYSAFIRLNLYEQAYGYTYIRFLVHAFMIFLALLLLIAALRIRYTSIPLIRWYIVLSLTAYVAINYVGMDHRIAALNIERYHQTGHIDASYLANLSSDAVPLLREFAEEYPELKDILLERYAYVHTEKVNHSWTSFNLARYRASRVLTPLRTE
ncbi:DUF4173 domain-containing protein [Paenibacillus sp. UMB7766-LJ446]|uniref:DUF4153 domain-containing protein n=1 Tax=Paenibacillus sp. UMB7766-LJ446 TaxID=3046313 RepID=UPI00255141DF|nr:DUF4173 domain-containing protein [Paenibacillus sp. UMB7766-LJ446]MDK8190789.1 DUF4173 domain-containing protein [Paenibacillus sp. UMB7766-LJ446]